MTTFIALLRGINVSGQKKIKMADLRACLQQHGFSEVRTYIQSGNILFTAEDADPAELAAQIHAAIEQQFGFDVPVQVLSAARVRQVVDANPFPDTPAEEYNRLLVCFLAQQPTQERAAAVAGYQDARDAFHLDGQAIYIYAPEGYGTSKLTNNFFEAKLKVQATTRNWKTLLKLLEMATKQ